MPTFSFVQHLVLGLVRGLGLVVVVAKFSMTTLRSNQDLDGDLLRPCSRHSHLSIYQYGSASRVESQLGLRLASENLRSGMGRLRISV